MVWATFAYLGPCNVAFSSKHVDFNAYFGVLEDYLLNFVAVNHEKNTFHFSKITLLYTTHCILYLG